MAKDNRIVLYSSTKLKRSQPNLPTYSPLNALTNTALSYPLKKGFTSIITLTRNLRNGNDEGKNQSIDSSSDHKSNASKDNSDNSKTSLSYNSSPTLHSRLNIVTSSIIKSIQEGNKYNLQKQNSLGLTTKCYQGICNILLDVTLRTFLAHKKDNHLLPIKILLSVGANPNYKWFKFDHSWLHEAVGCNLPNLVKLLCQYKADVNYVTDGIPLIIKVIQDKKRDIAQILLDHGANITDAHNNEGRTLLHLLASEHLDHDIIKQQLINITKSNIIDARDNIGFTPLHCAALLKNTEYAQLLIEQGADVNACNREGLTPLYYATLLGNTAYAKLLIANNADFTVCDHKGHTPLHCSVLLGNTACAELLIASGAVVNARNNEGHTPLHCAIIHGNTACAELLIERKADVNARDNKGHTPLHCSALRGNTAYAQLLIASGADVKLLSNDIIILAATANHWDVVKLLIEKGAAIDGHDNNHNNLMLLAVQNDKTEVVELLFNALCYCDSSNGKRLSYHECNKNGVTPLSAAITLQNHKMVELIVQNDNTIPPEYLTKWAEMLSIHPAVQMFDSLKQTIHRRGHTKSASNINTKEAVQEDKKEDLKDAYQNSDINFDVTAEESKSSEEPTVSGDTSSDTSDDL